MSSLLFRRSAAATAGAARAFSTTARRDLAKMTIVGNLADTPEAQATSTGREIVKYAVASNTGRSDNRHTSWFRITSFAEGPQKDYLLNLPKGALVYIEGEATMSQYQDAEGNNRSSLNIVQRNIEVLRRPQGERGPSE